MGSLFDFRQASPETFLFFITLYSFLVGAYFIVPSYCLRQTREPEVNFLPLNQSNSQLPKS